MNRAWLPTRMAIDVGQSLEDCLRSGWGSGKEISLRVVAILVGRVRHLHGLALLRGEVVLSLNLMLVPSLTGSNAISDVEAIGELAMPILLLVLIRHVGVGIVVAGRAGSNHQENGQLGKDMVSKLDRLEFRIQLTY